jgi:hypothetical protein
VFLRVHQPISVVTLGYILATPQCQASSGAMFKWLTADRDKGTRAFASVAEGLQSLYKDWLVVAKYLLPKRCDFSQPKDGFSQTIGKIRLVVSRKPSARRSCFPLKRTSAFPTFSLPN